MTDALHQVLGPFTSDDPDSTQLHSLVDRLASDGFTLPVGSLEELRQPTCCQLRQITEKLDTLDDDTKDQLCTYIGNDIDNNRTESYNLNSRENGSQYQLRPKPRQFFCDQYLADKSLHHNLFFNHTKHEPLTPVDHHAVGVWRKAKRRSEAEQAAARR